MYRFFVADKVARVFDNMALVVVRDGSPVYLLKAPSSKVCQRAEKAMLICTNSCAGWLWAYGGAFATFSVGYCRLNSMDKSRSVSSPAYVVQHCCSSANHLRSDLKVLDRFNEYFISAAVTPTMDILVMHASGSESKVAPLADAVRRLVVKVSLNPLCQLDKYIAKDAFDTAVRAAASKHLGWDV